MLILASGSPRRRELLTQIGVAYMVNPSSYHEESPKKKDPQKYVQDQALGKARDVAQKFPGQWVLGADTIVALDGVMMGTRCGSIDPATVCYLQREGGYTFDEVDEIMNKKAGLLAVTGGKTNDCRNVEELAAAGDPEAQLAFDMFVYKIAAKAAEMATSMCGMDTLVFTAGIGEHAPAVRAGVADRLAFMGVKMDHARNALRGDGAWCLSARIPRSRFSSSPRTRSS